MNKAMVLLERAHPGAHFGTNIGTFHTGDHPENRLSISLCLGCVPKLHYIVVGN